MVKPLIWIESEIERYAHSRVEYLIKARSQFKRLSTANNVQIVVPVPADADSPKFKTSVGSVRYVPEQSVLIWNIKSFPVICSKLMHFWIYDYYARNVLYRVVRNTWWGPILVCRVSSVRKRKGSHQFKWNLKSHISYRRAFR